MAQILAWGSSPLADVDRAWIELPAPGTDVEENRTYAGPTPDAPKPSVQQKSDTTT